MNDPIFKKIGPKHFIDVFSTIMWKNLKINTKLGFDHLMETYENRHNLKLIFKKINLSDPRTIINKCDGPIESS